MDRLTATSTAPAPDWPLPSLPLSSLTNVPEECKRHCRILPAGMVNLTLTQMADFVDREEQKKLDYKKVESTEHEFEKWAFERKKTQQKKNVEKKKVVEPNSFDEMIDSVDALLSSLTSPAEAIEPHKAPEAAATEQSSPLKADIIEIAIAELDACETAIMKPSSTPSTADTDKRAEAEAVATINSTIAPTLPIDFTTPLHSNPPSASEIAFARNLSKAHHARIMTVKATQYERMQNQNALAAFDVVTQYGKVMVGKRKLTFGAAVVKGFRGIFR